MGSNLDKHELTLIFLWEAALAWIWKGRENPSKRGNQGGLKNH